MGIEHTYSLDMTNSLRVRTTILCSMYYYVLAIIGWKGPQGYQDQLSN